MSDLVNESNNKKKGLGRGLGSLLGGSEGMASTSSSGAGASAFGSMSSGQTLASPKVESKPTQTTANQGVNTLNTLNNQTKAQVPVSSQRTMTAGQTPSQTMGQPAVVTQAAAVSGQGAISAQSAAQIPSANQSQNTAASLNLGSSVPQASLTTQASSTAAVAQTTEGKVWQVAIDKLTSGEYQPRQHFEKEALNELAQSIRANGILQPIVARKLPSGKMEIIAGERRWRAAQLAGLHEVPVLLRSFDDRQALEMAIVENVQREDLNPIEEAEGYSRLITEFNLSQQAVADKVGKERATVANAVRLLQLPMLVREMVSKSELSSGHAKVLLGLSDPNKMLELARRVVAEKIPVRKLEKLIAETNTAKEQKPLDSKQEMANRLAEGIAEDLQKLLGTKVSLDYRQGKGKVSIQFYSDDELTDLVEKLKTACQK